MKNFTLLLFMSVLCRLPLMAITPGGPGTKTLEVLLDNVSHVTCHGGNDGAISVSVSGGTPPYSFEWSNGETTQNLTDLLAGVYSLVVTDADDTKVALDEVEITEPDPLTLDFTVWALPGCDGQTGSLSVETKGGTPDYEYQWSNGETGNTLTGLDADVYEVVVTDANGCQASFSYALQPEYPVAAISSDGDVTCAHPVVTLDASASSSGDDFSFQWTASDGGQFVDPPDNLVALANAGGSYTLEITNLLNGCTAVISVDVKEDTVLPVADAGADSEMPCSNSQITLDGIGSMGDNFSYSWEALDGGNIIDGANTLSPTIDHAGTYILTIINNDNGCIASDEAVVTALAEAPSVDAEGGELTCLTTEISLSILSDPSGLLIEWSGPNGFSSQDPSPVVTDAGDYLLTVTDPATGCSNQVTVIVTDNSAAPIIAAEGGSITCIDAEVTLSASAEPGDVTYTWTGDGGFSSNEQNVTVSEPGEYVLEVTDNNNGCVATTSVTVLLDTELPVAYAGPAASLTCAVTNIQLDGSASSQGDDFTYEWTTADGNITQGEDTPAAVVDAPGTYTLTVTNLVNGCTASAEVVIGIDTEAPQVEVTGGEITCFQTEVQLQSIADPANVIFTWTLDNAFVSDEPNPSVAAGGEYVLTVTNPDNGCESAATALVLLNNTPPDLEAAGGTIGCSPNTVTLGAYSETPGAEYTWSGENGFSSTEQFPEVSEPGLYEVIVQDPANGCVAVASVTVGIDTEPPVADAGQSFAFNCFFTFAFLDGFGSSQGDEFSYQWTTTDGNIVDGDDTLFPGVDAPGTYTLVVTNNNNGCTASAEVVVGQTPEVNLEIVAVQDVSCYGTATGTATALASGGVGGFTYVWSSGSLDATATSLVAGSYSVTVYDEDFCGTETTVFIHQPDVLVVDAYGSSQSEPGVDDGKAFADVSGGVSPYSFEWSNGKTDSEIFDLAPGVYLVTVTDGNGCAVVAAATVGEFPCVLLGTIAATPVACFGGSDGTASVTLLNAEDPVSYLWSNGETTETIEGLAAGTYTVEVIDNTGCPLFLTVDVFEFSELLLSEIYHFDVYCPTDEYGSVTVGITGGVQPYSFEWSTGSDQPTAFDLAPGEYTLVVTDGNGCHQTLTTSISSTDDEPPLLYLQDATVSLDENGVVVLSPDLFDAGSFDICGIASWSISPESFDCSALGEQTVIISATDMNGNESTGTAIVTVEDNEAPVLLCPPSVVVGECNPVVDYDLPEILDNCDVDTDQLQMTEGLPSGSAFPTGTTTQVFTYSDPSGNAGECSFSVTVAEALSVSVASHDASCDDSCDGVIELTLGNGVPPYTVSWDNGDEGTFITGLCAGTYTAHITDDSGCDYTLSVTIEEPDALDITVLNVIHPVCNDDQSGAISVDITGGTAPYEPSWSNGSTGNDIDGLNAGIYYLDLTDANGCSAFIAVELAATDDEAPVLILQNATFNLDANGIAMLNPAAFDAGSTDNCGIVAWMVLPNSFDCNDLGDHTVTLTAVDANGNASTGTATVTIGDGIAPALTCPGNISVGFCDATVVYDLPQIVDNCPINPALLQLVSGLPPGFVFPAGTTNQTFSFTDASGNTGFCSFTVTVQAAGVISSAVKPVFCHGGCDGAVTLDIAGGSPPFTIVWSNGQTGPTASNLCAGNYIAVVTDANGCVQTISALVAEPTQINIDVVSVNSDVNGAGVGAININVTGGVPPYTYQWTKNGQPFATTEDLTNLNAGQYVVVVTDATGCIVNSQSIAVDNTTGTGKPVWSVLLSLQPNPTTDWVRLSTSQPLAQTLEVLLLDVAGRRMRSFSVEAGRNDMTLDLRELPAGIYSVQLRLAGETAVKHLVIVR